MSTTLMLNQIQTQRLALSADPAWLRLSSCHVLTLRPPVPPSDPAWLRLSSCHVLPQARPWVGARPLQHGQGCDGTQGRPPPHTTPRHLHVELELELGLDLKLAVMIIVEESY